MVQLNSLNKLPKSQFKEKVTEIPFMAMKNEALKIKSTEDHDLISIKTSDFSTYR